MIGAQMTLLNFWPNEGKPSYLRKGLQLLNMMGVCPVPKPKHWPGPRLYNEPGFVQERPKSNGKFDKKENSMKLDNGYQNVFDPPGKWVDVYQDKNSFICCGPAMFLEYILNIVVVSWVDGTADHIPIQNIFRVHVSDLPKDEEKESNQ
jgi:hypothetical protein